MIGFLLPTPSRAMLISGEQKRSSYNSTLFWGREERTNFVHLKYMSCIKMCSGQFSQLFCPGVYVYKKLVTGTWSMETCENYPLEF